MSKIPYGTPLVATTCSPDVISISSFNLLAPLYIRPIDQRTGEVQPFAAFEWVKDDDLIRSETRLPRLLECLQNCGTDFICVQELQLETVEGNHAVLPVWIKPLMSRYQIILPSQEQLTKISKRNQRVLLTDVAVTNAIFYKSSRWVPVSRIKTNDDNDNTTTCTTQAFRSVDEDVASIVVSSLHLDASREDKRCSQIQRCLRQTLAFSSNNSHSLPLIMAGDYNCELSSGSCVNAFLTNSNSDKDGSIECYKSEMDQNKIRECAASLRIPLSLVSSDQIKEWHSLYEDVENYVYDYCWQLRRLNTGYTRAALDHDKTNDNSSQSSHLCLKLWKLDHFVYTSNTLEPIQFWSTLEDDESSVTTGLPNERVPTDHLPLAAIFKRNSYPQLDEGLRIQLLKSLNDLESNQDNATRDMNAAMDEEKIKLEDKLRRQGETNTKKPPPEMVQHIRTSRSLKKRLKQTQAEERQQFVSGRCVLERMELQHALGITCKEWIEKGRAK